MERTDWLTDQIADDWDATVLHPAVRGEDRVVAGHFVCGRALSDASGTWFESYEATSGEAVAIRRLQLGGDVPQAVVQRVRQDIHRAASSLRPYMLHVRECAIHEDGLWIVTEPHGISLADVMAGRRLTLGEALTYGRHIASALAYAHTHQVVHGLLTPAAIDLLTLEPVPFQSQAGVGLGTARLGAIGLIHVAPFALDALPADGPRCQSYRAPEERRGAVPGPASDLYHLGALLWEMVLGAPPPAINPQASSAVLAPLPLEMQEVILACLHPDPQQRPPHLEAILAELRAVQRILQGKTPSETVARFRAASRPASLQLGAEAAPARPPARPPIVHPLRPDGQVSPTSPRAMAPASDSDPEHPASGWSSQTREAAQALPRRLRQMSRTRQIIALGAAVAAVLAIAVFATGLVNLQTSAAAVRHDDVVLHQGMTTLAPRPTPYAITHTLVIGEDQTLRLEPGVTLLFAPGTELIVRGGSLEAQGTDQQPVILTGTEQAGTWSGFRVQAGEHGAPGHVALDHVILRYAGTAAAAAIRCDMGALIVTNSTQSDSLGDGLLASKDCWGEVAGNTFARDGHNAVTVASPALRFHDNNNQGLPVSLP